MSSWLLIGIPLLIFAIIDSFGNQKAALISAIVIALAEFVFSYYLIGEVDWTSVVSIGLVIILAVVSLMKEDSLHFKMQPAIVAAIIGVLFLGTYLLGKPFLYEMMVKYKSLIPENQQAFLDYPGTKRWFNLISLYCGVFFLIHAAFMVWVARACSNWVWILGRMVGTFASCGAAILAAKIHMG